MPTEDENHYKEKLRQAEARFRTVFEKLPAGLLVLKPDGTIAFSNSKAARMLAVDASLLSGQSICERLVAKGYESFESIVNYCSINAKPLELEAHRAQLSKLPVELSLSEFEIDGRQVYLASFSDISERKRLEKLKDELIAMVSHDLATPLSSIQLTLNLLSSQASDMLSEKMTTQVKRAERSAGQLIKLINDLLTVERLESGRVDMMPELMDCGQLVADTIDLVHDKAAERNIEIITQVVNTTIVADKERLQQVLMNFLSNAIKFSPENAQIIVGVQSSGERSKFFVSDKGRGVPVQDHERIFERFQQVEVADAREKGGRGLGLAICKAIVLAHGGSIGVTGGSGAGSTFWFSIPSLPDPRSS